AETSADMEKETFSSEYTITDERRTVSPTVLVIADTKEEHPDEKPDQVLIAEAETESEETGIEKTWAEIQPDVTKETETERNGINGISPDIRLANDILPVQRNRNSAMQFLAGSMVTYTTGEVADGMGFAAGVTGDFPPTACSWSASPAPTASTPATRSWSRSASRGG
ncbi:MAG: hypothetical protein R6X35_02635, partial [Candidatus Krumholzibacteriia bacterium]